MITQETEWQKAKGDILDRVAEVGRFGFEFAKRFQDPVPEAPNKEWRIIRRLGLEYLSLQKKREKYARGDPTYQDDSDEEWDTRDWDERDINTAATTLIDEIRNSAERHRREAAGRLLERLFQRHPTSETFIAHSTVVEEAMNAALRVPHGTPLEPDRRSFHLLAVLTPFFSDLMIRRGAIRRSAEVLNYEVDLAARRIQNAWKRRQYYTRDLMRFKSKKLRVRTEVLLLLTRGMIKGRWRMMLNSDYQGVLPVGTLEFLLLYLAALSDDSCSTSDMNRLNIIQDGALWSITYHMTHTHFGVRKAAGEVVLNLTRDGTLRASLLAFDVQSQLLTLLHAKGVSLDQARAMEAQEEESPSQGLASVVSAAAGGEVKTKDGTVITPLELDELQAKLWNSKAKEKETDAIVAEVLKEPTDSSAPEAPLPPEEDDEYEASDTEESEEELEPLEEGDEEGEGDAEEGEIADEEGEGGKQNNGGEGIEGGDAARSPSLEHAAEQASVDAKGPGEEGEEAFTDTAEEQEGASNEAVSSGKLAVERERSKEWDGTLPPDNDKTVYDFGGGYADLCLEDRLRALDILDVLIEGPEEPPQDLDSKHKYNETAGSDVILGGKPLVNRNAEVGSFHDVTTGGESVHDETVLTPRAGFASSFMYLPADASHDVASVARTYVHSRARHRRNLLLELKREAETAGPPAELTSSKNSTQGSAAEGGEEHKGSEGEGSASGRGNAIATARSHVAASTARTTSTSVSRGSAARHAEVGKTTAENYTEAHAASEGILFIDGDDYYSTLMMPDMQRRLAHLLAARDADTRLGAVMVLTKAISGVLHEELVELIVSRPRAIKSLAAILKRDDEHLLFATVIFIRELIAKESSRRALLRTGFSKSPLGIAAKSPRESFADTGRPGDDDDPLELTTPLKDAKQLLLRLLLHHVMPSSSSVHSAFAGQSDQSQGWTAADEAAAVTVIGLHKLRVVPQLVRFLCGGLDFMDLQAHEESEEVEALTTARTARGLDTTEEGAVERKEAQEEEDSKENDGSDVDAKQGDDRDNEEKAAKHEDETEEVEENEEEEEEEDDEERIARRNEFRFLSPIILDKIAECDDALPALAVPRVVAYLVSVLKENVAELQELAHISETTAGNLPGDDKDYALLQLSTQSACRLLTTLCRAKALSVDVRSQLCQALLTLGAPYTLLDLLDERLTIATVRAQRAAKVIAREAKEDFQRVEQRLQEGIVAGLSPDTIRDIEDEKKVVEARYREEKLRYTTCCARKESEEVTIGDVVTLLGCIPPAVQPEDVSAWLEAGLPAEAGRWFVERDRDEVVFEDGPEDTDVDIDAVLEAETSQDPVVAAMQRFQKYLASLPQYVARVVPVLCDVCARTRIPSVRSTCLWSLSRLAFSTTTARMVLSLGGFDLILALLPDKSVLHRQAAPTKVTPLADADIVADNERQPFSTTRPPPSPVSMSPLSASAATWSRFHHSKVRITDHGTTASSIVDETVEGQAGGQQLSALVKLPVPLYTLISAVSVVPEACNDLIVAGVFERCVQRFGMTTRKPHVDMKAQGEVALFIARAGCRHVDEWGSVNEYLARFPHTTLAPSEERVGVVAERLVGLLHKDIHKRARYHALMALARLCEDQAVMVPRLVKAGVIEQLPPFLDIRSPTFSYAATCQAMRIVECIAGLKGAPYAYLLAQSGVIKPLQQVAFDLKLEDEEKENGRAVTLGAIARKTLAALGEHYAKAPSSSLETVVDASVTSYTSHTKRSLLEEAQRKLQETAPASPSRSTSNLTSTGLTKITYRSLSEAAAAMAAGKLPPRPIDSPTAGPPEGGASYTEYQNEQRERESSLRRDIQWLRMTSGKGQTQEPQSLDRSMSSSKEPLTLPRVPSAEKPIKGDGLGRDSRVRFTRSAESRNEMSSTMSGLGNATSKRFGKSSSSVSTAAAIQAEYAIMMDPLFEPGKRRSRSKRAGSEALRPLPGSGPYTPEYTKAYTPEPLWDVSEQRVGRARAPGEYQESFGHRDPSGRGRITGFALTAAQQEYVSQGRAKKDGLPGKGLYY